MQQLIHSLFILETRTLGTLAANIRRDGNGGQSDAKTAIGDCGVEHRYRLLGRCRKRRASDQHV
jgi:hypothetical protein